MYSCHILGGHLRKVLSPLVQYQLAQYPTESKTMLMAQSSRYQQMLKEESLEIPSKDVSLMKT